MNKYEFMRRMICGLCIWNLILTIGLCGAAVNKEEIPTPTFSPAVNEQICELELIPFGELQ